MHNRLCHETRSICRTEDCIMLNNDTFNFSGQQYLSKWHIADKHSKWYQTEFSEIPFALLS